MSDQVDEGRGGCGLDTGDFMKGLFIGVAAALALGGLIALVTTKRRSSREAMRPTRRVENYSHSDETLGEVPDRIDEPGGGLIETIRSVNEALETGRQAMETIKSVIENVRGR